LRPHRTLHSFPTRRSSDLSIAAEMDRIESGPTFARPLLVQAENGMPIGPFSQRAMAAFAERLGAGKFAALSEELPLDRRAAFDRSEERRVGKEGSDRLAGV